MRKLLAGLFLVAAMGASAAITHDANSSVQSSSSTATVSWSHTLSGTNTVIVAGCSFNDANASGSGHVNGITANGTALTAVRTINASSGTKPGYTAIWIGYIKGVSAGTISMVGTASEATGTTLNALACAAISFDGVNQTTPLDSSGPTPGTGTTSPASISVTTVNANAWIVDMISEWNGGFPNPTKGASQTLSTCTSLYGAQNMCMSYQGPVVSPGATADSWTDTNVTGWTLTGLSLNPAGAGVVRHRASVISQ